jgi:hypothetical protein
LLAFTRYALARAAVTSQVRVERLRSGDLELRTAAELDAELEALTDVATALDERDREGRDDEQDRDGEPDAPLADEVDRALARVQIVAEIPET